MTWDPYETMHHPDETTERRDRRLPAQEMPAKVRTVLAVFAAMVLLALIFSTAANAQEGGTEQQEEQTQVEKAQDPDAQTEQTQQTQQTQTQEQQAQESTQEAAEAPIEGQFVEQPKDTFLASELIGQSVYSADDDDIGRISDLVVTESNRIVGVVIGVGGFLGIGEKPVAVKMDRVKEGTARDGSEQLVLDFTREELEQAPEFVSLAEQMRRQEAEQVSQQQQEMQQQQQAQQQGSADAGEEEATQN